MLKRILLVLGGMMLGAVLLGPGYKGVSAAVVLNLPDDIIGCPDDMSRVGPVCVDKWEASVFPNADGTGTQLGVGMDDYTTSAGCENHGSGCGSIFAASKMGVTPSTRITWFQADQACLNVGKRLLRNGEWHGAAADTPDPGTDNGSTDCNIITTGAISLTGSRSLCKSRWEVYDMVGNVWEWVEDWVPRSTTCGTWSVPGGDAQCLAGAATTGEPGALMRGGDFGNGASAGVFAVSGTIELSIASSAIGFRCAR